MRHGKDIPFDLKDVRTVFYDLHDPDKLEAAQEELELKVAAIEASTEPVRNPITVTRNVTLLQQSEDPEHQAAGAVLAAVSDLRDEMRSLLRRTERSARGAVLPPEEARAALSDLLADESTYSLEAITARVNAPPSWIRRRIKTMVERGDLFEVDGGFSTIPF